MDFSNTELYKIEAMISNEKNIKQTDYFSQNELNKQVYFKQIISLKYFFVVFKNLPNIFDGKLIIRNSILRI